MGAGLILAGLVLICLGISGWLWLCAGFRSGGWRGVTGTLALQVSAVCLAYGLVRGRPLFALFTAMFPPLAVLEVARAGQYLEFIKTLTWALVPYAGVALVVCLAWRPLRRWSLGITALGALVAALVVGDQISQDAMCRAAAKHGFSAFLRNSFGWSLANTLGIRELDNLHAVATATDRPLGWSYAKMDWFVLPDVTGVSPVGPVFICPPAR